MGGGGALDARSGAEGALIALALALAVLLQDEAGPIEAGLRAVREGRYEDGARLLGEAPETRKRYEALVALGIARGRLGNLSGAGDALDQAVALEPSRREARVERGGLRFLQKRYAEAAHDLGLARDRHPADVYVRDLLASTLLLAGRPEEALEEWNALDRPRLTRVDIKGLRHASDAWVRRELTVAEARTLEVDQFRESRLRLEETGMFESVRLRALPVQEGEVMLEVDLLERHGFGLLPEVVIRGAVDLARKRVRAHYDNLMGSGLRLSGEYRWERTQPTVALGLEMPRPFGLPANVHLEARRSRPMYDLDDLGDASAFTLRTSGLDASLRRVVSPRTVAEIGFRLRDRNFTIETPDTPEGRILGFHALVDRRILDAWRHRLDASVQAFHTAGALGSEVSFAELRVRSGASLFLRPPEPVPVQKSVLAAQLNWGWGSDGMPLDQMFSPGAASDMVYPLRAHRQKRGGVLGRAPLGRSLSLVNAEMRQRLLNRKDLQIGAVAFYDGGRIGRSAPAAKVTVLHDVGLGLRFGLRRTVVLRFDYAYSLTDGKNSLTAGVGQVF
jgi:hypothetical protein